MNKTLTQLKLKGKYISQGAREIAAALKVNKSLTQLNLDSNKIGAEGAQEIAEALKAIAKALEFNKSLTQLNLNNNQIGTKGATAITKGLEFNKSLKELDLSHNKIDKEGSVAIVAVLKVNPTLIEIKGVDITKEDLARWRDELYQTRLEERQILDEISGSDISKLIQSFISAFDIHYAPAQIFDPISSSSNSSAAKRQKLTLKK